MKNYTKSITDELLHTVIVQEKLPILLCPKCKNQQLIIRDKVVKCPDDNCGWIQFRVVCGVKIMIADIVNLVNAGKTSLIRGMKSKSGKLFNAYILLNKQGDSTFAFEETRKR